MLVPDFGKTKVKDAATTFQYKSAALPVKSSYHFKIVASSWVDHSNGPTTYNNNKGYWNDGPAVEAFAPGNSTCGASAYPAACPSCVTPATYSSALAQGPAYPTCGLTGQNPAKRAVLGEVAALTSMYGAGETETAPPPAPGMLVLPNTRVALDDQASLPDYFFNSGHAYNHLHASIGIRFTHNNNADQS